MRINFLQVQFYLHKHMLVISERELLEIEHYQSRWPLFTRGNTIHIYPCASNPAMGDQVLLNRNKLLRYIIQYLWPHER
jgi:hypothetical protein